MRLKYDAAANALYIRLQEGIDPVRGVEIDRGTIVDLADDDSVIGIEVLNPARTWPLTEIVDRFHIDDLNDVLALKNLWNENARYPYVAPVQTGREREPALN